MKHESRLVTISIEAAQLAAARGQLYSWTIDYLTSEHEEQLLEYLRANPQELSGPTLVQVNFLERTIGPEESMPNSESATDYDLKIHRRIDQIRNGLQTPIIAEYSDGKYLICDGNHLYEAYLTLGNDEVMVIYWTGDDIRKELTRIQLDRKDDAII